MEYKQSLNQYTEYKLAKDEIHPQYNNHSEQESSYNFGDMIVKLVIKFFVLCPLFDASKQPCYSTISKEHLCQNALKSDILLQFKWRYLSILILSLFYPEAII